MTDLAPWPLTVEDLPWVVDLADRRRARLVPEAPRFWRPSADAHERHQQFLGRLIESPDVLSVRTLGGFLFGLRRDDLLVVDDMALEQDADWSVEGRALLGRAQADGGRVRFVCPVFESARASTGRSCGLEVAETWWHRDLPVPRLALTQPHSDDPHIFVEGAEGRLIPAPPVYDPGGPVLLVTTAENLSALRRIEESAIRRGATVSVVTQAPGDVGLVDVLGAAGYRRTTDFFESPGP